MAGPLHIEVLKEMERLAADRSPEARRTLGKALSNWASSSEVEMSPQEWALVSEIYGVIATDIEAAVRRRLAEKLSARGDIPHSLIIALANDEITVAKQVLLQSPILSDEDLVRIVELRTSAHKATVAARPHIGAKVSESIAVSGDVKAIQLLLGNKTADIEEKTFIHIGHLSRRKKVLQEALVHHPDVPYKAVEAILDVVTGELLKEISERWSVPQSTLLREMAATRKELAEETRKTRRVPVPPSSDEKETLIARLKEGDVNGASWVLYHSMRLPLGVSKAVLSDTSGIMLAIVLKSMNADSLTYSRALAVLSRRDPSDDADFYRDMLQRYAGMTQQWAKDQVNQWRRDPNSAKPPGPEDEEG